MQELTASEICGIPEGGAPLRTICGISVGMTIGATVGFGLTGFLLTFNKAAALCSLSSVL